MSVGIYVLPAVLFLLLDKYAALRFGRCWLVGNVVVSMQYMKSRQQMQRLLFGDNPFSAFNEERSAL